MKSEQLQTRGDEQHSGEKAGRSHLAYGSLPAIAFIAIVLIAGGVWWSLEARQANAVKQRQASNEAFGLPLDYPSDFLPVYPNAAVLEVERGQATSTMNEPMDKWYIHAQFNDDRKRVFDYYCDLMINSGMRQTQSVSLPASDGSGANYGVDYANEEYIANFIIEKQSTDELSQLEITLYRVRK